MTSHISKMLEKGDPDAIQKYVKNHLPNDQLSLERIYKELLSYEPKPQQPKLIRPIKSKSTAILAKKLDYLSRNAPEQEYSKRSILMMRGLKQKGLKIYGFEGENGLEIFKQRREVIVKPKITNSKLLITKQAEIDRLIERFNLNPNFYTNNIEDVEIKIQEAVDRDMRQFIDRRLTALKDLKNKKNTVHVENGRYGSVPSKLKNGFTPKASFEQIPSLQKSSKTLSRLSSTNLIMVKCKQQILKQQMKTVPSFNHFLQLQKHSDLFYIPSEVDIGSIINLDKVRERLSKQQYERYTHSYMKMMTNKISQGSKCKLNNYAKELLHDARKMRNIIDFSKK